MRALTAILTVLCMSGAWADAPAAASTPPPAGASRHLDKMPLGKIEVTGMKPLVETLREVKVAVKRPFDNDPAHFDDMVCRFDDHGLGTHTGMLLECGTQGWFSMQRNAYSYGGAMQGSEPAVSSLGHPWHTVRALDPHQMAALRELLKELPPPGQGDVQIVDEAPAPSTR
jgi:hypothetical protein